MIQTCDICQPSAKHYIVQFNDASDLERLRPYYHSPLDECHPIDAHHLRIKEPQFFDLMDYLEAHMDTEKIYAKSEDNNGLFAPVLSYKGEKEHIWVDKVIEEGRLTTYFQPIIEHGQGDFRIYGYECLSRGLDEKEEVIPAFKLFESARARQKLFALDRACRMNSIKNGEKVKNKKLFINFIPTAIYVPEHCLASTFRLIRKLGMNPEQIVFEVVETDKVENNDHLKNILDYYRANGFKYAFDDVGTGYNKLEELPDLNPDYIKLAIEFTNGVATDSEKQEVALLMLKISKKRGARALAEGVETKEDLDWLIHNGYDLFQGYYFAKPTPDPINESDLKIPVF